LLQIDIRVLYLEPVDKARILYKGGSEFLLERFKVKYIAAFPRHSGAEYEHNIEYKGKTLHAIAAQCSAYKGGQIWVPASLLQGI
jgi:hypothetical protein